MKVIWGTLGVILTFIIGMLVGFYAHQRWGDRYFLISASSSNNVCAYKIDRRTGQVWFIWGARRECPVSPVDSAKIAAEYYYKKRH